MSIALTSVEPLTVRDAGPGPWLRSARWDLSFIVFSAAVAFLPSAVYVHDAWLFTDSDALVPDAAAVGSEGPHA